MDENKKTDPEATGELPTVEQEKTAKEQKPPKVRPMEKAQRMIERALTKAEIPYHGEHVQAALTTMYVAYESQGVLPTRSGFAECCADQQAASFVLHMEKDPFIANNKKKVVAIIAAAAAAIVVVAGGIAWGLNYVPEPLQEQTPENVESPAPDAVQAMLNVTLKADGADAQSTKAKVEVLDSEGLAVIPSTEVAPNISYSLGELPEGEYTLHIVQVPVNMDGSTYKQPEDTTPVSVGADGAPVSIEISLEKLAAEDMSKEQLEATAKVLEDNGKPEASKAVQNKAQAAPSAPGSDATVKPASPSPSKPASTSATTTTPSQPSAPSKPSQPAHTHNWVAQTKTVHHDAEYKTVHHDAVTKGATVCTGCWQVVSDPAAHAKEALKNNNYTCGKAGYTVKTVTVQEAYDEKVLVKDAWDETVVTGYKCSGCGATK